MPSPIVVVFRYDDYSASRGEADRAKDELELRLLELFGEQGVPLTLGVVPLLGGRWALGDDATKLGALREAVGLGRVEAALHGYTHEALTKVGSRDSEFAGRLREEQLDRLRKGRALLEGLLAAPVESFIPPWNAADAATGEALVEAGFSVISASLTEPLGLQIADCRLQLEIRDRAPLVSLPHTCGLPQLRRAVRGLARHDGPAVSVCMFHEFSFRDSPHPLARRYGRLSLAELGELLAWCREQPGVECRTLSQAAREHREALLDGRVDEARELWGLLLNLRRVPLIGRAARWLWTPLALAQPGWHGRALSRVRTLARLFA